MKIIKADTVNGCYYDDNLDDCCQLKNTDFWEHLDILLPGITIATMANEVFEAKLEKHYGIEGV